MDEALIGRLRANTMRPEDPLTAARRLKELAADLRAAISCERRAFEAGWRSGQRATREGDLVEDWRYYQCMDESDWYEFNTLINNPQIH